MGRPATGGKFLDHPHGPSVGIWRRAILYAGQGIVKPLGQGADLPLMDHRLFLAKHQLPNGGDNRGSAAAKGWLERSGSM